MARDSSSLPATEDEVRLWDPRFSSILRAAGLKGFYVSDGSRIYHRLYTSTIIASGGKAEVGMFKELLTPLFKFPV